MKKGLKVLFGTLIFLMLILTLTGCKNKKTLSPDDFKKTMEAKEFEVIDTMDQMPEESIVTQSYLALAPKSLYKIEYYKFSSIDEAKNFYSTNKKIFEASAVTGSSHKEVTINNYSKFTMTSGDKYMVISRIDDTAIYIDVDKDYKDTINKILKELDY